MRGLHEVCVRACVRACVRLCVQHVNSVASLICFAYTLSHSFSLPFMSFQWVWSENKPF